ncbi:hypothetical protein Zmor_021751 [Zophobas morio]|uniref:Endonuclease/exonuclease/phosphatase domain-containing protein n=1 Tax=Zophobas morio TaxID=2755281 RepID=A0AA38I646_9CUCU|nr:hypothetical protein Zmor_021751 [Zophobas morio]
MPKCNINLMQCAGLENLMQTMIDTLKTEFLNAIEQLKTQFEQKLNELFSNKSNIPDDLDSETILIDELADRQSRAGNIIPYNLPESGNGVFSQNNYLDGVKTIQKGLEIADKDKIHTLRLGRPGVNPRPLKQHVAADVPDAGKKLSDDEIINEVEERNKRATNLTLLNLPGPNENSAELRKTSDLSNCITTILPDANADNTSILSCVRLGKFNKEKIRPLRIVFTTSQLALQVVKAYQRKDVDLIGISLTLNDQLKLNIINVYLPPGSPTEYYDVIFEYLENNCLLSSNTVIVGDFNIPQYYVQMVLNKALNYISSSSIFLRDFLNVNNLRQCNFVLNSNTRLLDLVLISDNLNCTVSRNENPLVTEDQHHPSLSLTLGIPMSKKVTITDYIVHCVISIDWFRVMVITNVNEALDSFYDEIFNLFNTYIPKSTVRTSSYPMWFTPTIIDLVKKKQQMWKRFKKFGYERDLMQVNSLRKRIKNDIKKEYTNFISLAEHNIKGDPKNLWKDRVNRFTGNSESLRRLL